MSYCIYRHYSHWNQTQCSVYPSTKHIAITGKEGDGTGPINTETLCFLPSSGPKEPKSFFSSLFLCSH